VLVNHSTVFSEFSGGTILLVPPKVLLRGIYRCDSKFHLDSILEMFDDGIKYGVILISGKEYAIYQVNQTGTHFEYRLLLNKNIHQPNKHNKGGQSSVRFERIRKNVHGHFVDQISEDAVKVLMTNNNTECIISKLIVGGSAEMKTEVKQSELFKQHLSKYMINTVNTTDVSEKSAEYAISMSIDESELNDKKKIDAEIDTLMFSSSDLLTYGESECLSMLTENLLQKIYVEISVVTDEIKDYLITFRLTNKTNILFVKSDKLKLFNGFLGVRHFVTN
jgi:peptide subunit release factor 1 (eRF1)